MECGKWKVELFQFGKWNKLYFYKEWIMVFLCCFFPDLYIINIVRIKHTFIGKSFSDNAKEEQKMGMTFIPIGIGIAVLLILIIFLCSIYKVADIDKALIITGGKEPKIKVSGGSFVIPVFRKAQYFDLCMLTVTADCDEVKTKTAVPIVIDWTAQIRPDVNDMSRLKKAIMSFKERGQNGIINDVRLTLTGAVRDIVASMTPEAVLMDKQTFTEKVKEIVADEMVNMGMELVSLNIQDITDNNGYYDNMAAPDMQEKRKTAETTTAMVDQEVRTQKAAAEKTAKQNELASQLEIAEKERDNKLKLAEFRSQTDKAEADAAIAGELQKTVRQQEVAEQQGRVEVVRQEQANLAAQKEKDVIATRAEAEKQRKQIEAEAAANIKKIDAEAQVQVAEKEANAIKIKAEAEAERIKKEGSAEAEVAKMKGIAEAEAEKAKLMAKAEGERALAEARASNEKVNFEIEKVKIETQARIEIATKTATIMAELGKNAQFVNIGGSSQGSQTGNALLDTLSGIPELMKILDTKNQALNGKSFNEELNGLVRAAAEPIKGVLSTSTTENITNNITEHSGSLPADNA